MHSLSMEVNLVRAQGPILQIDLINHDMLSLPYESMISKNHRSLVATNTQ